MDRSPIQTNRTFALYLLSSLPPIGRLWYSTSFQPCIESGEHLYPSISPRLYPFSLLLLNPRLLEVGKICRLITTPCSQLAGCLIHYVSWSRQEQLGQKRTRFGIHIDHPYPIPGIHIPAQHVSYEHVDTYATAPPGGLRSRRDCHGGHDGHDINLR